MNSATALELFPVSATPAPDIRLDVSYAGPAVPELLGVSRKRDPLNPTCLEFSVSLDPRACPICDQPVDEMDPRPTLTFVSGELRHCHKLCGEKASGSGPAGMSVRRQSRGIPDCKHCGAPYLEGHYHCSTHGTYCEDGEPYQPTETAAA